MADPESTIYREVSTLLSSTERTNAHDSGTTKTTSHPKAGHTCKVFQYKMELPEDIVQGRVCQIFFSNDIYLKEPLSSDNYLLCCANDVNSEFNVWFDIQPYRKSHEVRFIVENDGTTDPHSFYVNLFLLPTIPPVNHLYSIHHKPFCDPKHVSPQTTIKSNPIFNLCDFSAFISESKHLTETTDSSSISLILEGRPIWRYLSDVPKCQHVPFRRSAVLRATLPDNGNADDHPYRYLRYARLLTCSDSSVSISKVIIYGLQVLAIHLSYPRVRHTHDYEELDLPFDNTHHPTFHITSDEPQFCPIHQFLDKTDCYWLPDSTSGCHQRHNAMFYGDQLSIFRRDQPHRTNPEFSSRPFPPSQIEIQIQLFGRQECLEGPYLSDLRRPVSYMSSPHPERNFLWVTTPHELIVQNNYKLRIFRKFHGPYLGIFIPSFNHDLIRCTPQFWESGHWLDLQFNLSSKQKEPVKIRRGNTIGFIYFTPRNNDSPFPTIGPIPQNQVTYDRVRSALLRDGPKTIMALFGLKIDTSKLPTLRVVEST